MDPNSLVISSFDSGSRFLAEFDKFVPIVVAFWVRESDSERWTLCVASDRIDEKNFDVAYGEVLRIASAMKDPDLDPFQVRVLGLRDPLSRLALHFYQRRAGHVPIRVVGGPELADVGVDELNLVRGPKGDFAMPTGRETLHQIIDKEAEFFQQHGTPPHKMKLPVLMAYDLAKCGREDLGELSGKVFKDGITVFEREGFHGMNVEIVREPDASLEFE